MNNQDIINKGNRAVADFLKDNPRYANQINDDNLKRLYLKYEVLNRMLELIHGSINWEEMFYNYSNRINSVWSEIKKLKSERVELDYMMLVRKTPSINSSGLPHINVNVSMIYIQSIVKILREKGYNVKVDIVPTESGYRLDVYANTTPEYALYLEVTHG